MDERRFNAKLLNREEEIALIVRAQAGDQDAMRQVFEAQYRWVWKIAKKFEKRCRWMDIEDLVQLGSIGLLRAIKKFDVTRNCRLSTYSSFWIMQFIRLELETVGIIRVPCKSANRDKRQDKVDAARGVKYFGDRVFDIDSCEPSAEAATEESEYTIGQLTRMRQEIAKLPEPLRNAIEGQINGELLREAGASAGVSRELIRQRREKAIRILKEAVKC